MPNEKIEVIREQACKSYLKALERLEAAKQAVANAKSTLNSVETELLNAQSELEKQWASFTLLMDPQEIGRKP